LTASNVALTPGQGKGYFRMNVTTSSSNNNCGSFPDLWPFQRALDCEISGLHYPEPPPDRLNPALALALDYAQRGWNPVPIPFKTKKPLDEGWPRRVIREAEAARFFSTEPMNIGIVLGPTSRGLTDIDLDCAEAIEIAPAILPPTKAIFGRASKRASHRLYYHSTLAATLGQAALQLKDPITKGVLLEVRVGGDKGAQTVFPGSTHESGEPIKWDESGEPAQAGDDLVRLAKVVGALSLMARYWPAGSRHDAALTVGGFLARCGLKPPFVKTYVEFVARAAKDEEVRDRIKAAEDAANAHQAGDKTRGYPALKEVFGHQVAERVADWLEYSGSRTSEGKPAAGANDIVTEDSAAQQFVEDHGEELRFCHSHHTWFRWNGVYWAQDETGVAFHWARQLARRLAGDQDARRRYMTSKTSFATGVEKFAKVDPKVAVTIGYWDRNPWLLGTPGGTIDLRTGKLSPSRPDDGITKIASVTPAATACPLWLRFLNETTGGDAELIRFLQMWCGYSLTGITREHALVFVYGTGGNGKGVFSNVIMTILNDYAKVSATETFTASNSDAPHGSRDAARREAGDGLGDRRGASMG
jgi:D5-like protein/bifunctional DNA primase/polymerase-like protein